MKNIYFEIRREFVKQEIQAYEKQLKSMPEGVLTLYQNGKHVKWFCQTVGENGKQQRRYIPKDSRKEAEQLAKKQILSRNLRDRKNELAAIDSYLRVRSRCKADKCHKTDEELYKLLPEEFDLTKRNFQPNNNHQEALTVRGPKGELMRSKSEAIIAHVLNTNGISYLYEHTWDLGGVYISPDFTIIHPITRKEYLWEHLGLMDKQGYRKNLLLKLNTYVPAGFIPDHNLIFTFETNDQPLDINYVQNLVNFYFGSDQQIGI